MEDNREQEQMHYELGVMLARLVEDTKPTNDFGYVPNYPKPIDTNPFNLVEGNENKMY